MSKKSYRGIIWNGSNRDLSIALGLSETAAHNWLSRHRDKTQEDYIDYCLGIKSLKAIEDKDNYLYRHWICESCGTIKYGSGNDVKIRACDCGGKICPLDEGMVQILRDLHSKRYKTDYCCQGHYRYEPAFNSMIYEDMYISFIPVDVLDTSSYFEIQSDRTDAINEILSAANANTVKMLSLNKYIDLKFEWTVYNEISIGATGPFAINKSHSIHVRYQGEYESDLLDDVESDLLRIREYVHESLNTLKECEKMSYVMHSNDDDYHSIIISSK